MLHFQVSFSTVSTYTYAPLHNTHTHKISRQQNGALRQHLPAVKNKTPEGNNIAYSVVHGLLIIYRGVVQCTRSKQTKCCSPLFFFQQCASLFVQTGGGRPLRGHSNICCWWYFLNLGAPHGDGRSYTTTRANKGMIPRVRRQQGESGKFCQTTYAAIDS